MYPLISVNIPSYDEGQHITHTIDSVLNQNYSGDLEIRVCANGCSKDDQTEEKVLEMAKSYSNIRLISTEEKGKPNAWNLLRESANSNYQVFTDGDVIIEQNAIKLLYEHLINNPELTAVGGNPISHPASDSFLDKAIVPPTGDLGSLTGRLYLVDNFKLNDAMKKRGYTLMPKEIINEDFWVSLIIGKNNYEVSLKSKVHSKYPNWKELKKVNLRLVRGAKQIQSKYSELLPEKESKIEAFKRRYGKLNNFKGFNKFIGLSSYAHRIFLNLYCGHLIKKENLRNAQDGWEFSKITKTPFKVNFETK